MANIDKELSQIKNAIYGREVRGSIHDGIKKINTESEGSRTIANNNKQRQDAIEQQFADLQQNYSEGTPSTAEVVAARTNTDTSENYSTIGHRMDEEYKKVTSQLAEEEKQRHYESLVNRKDPGLMISWIDDDGFVEVYDRMLPLMEEYNIPLSSAIITKRVGTNDSKYLNIEQIKELQSKGMEFFSHTHNHEPNYRPIEMTEEELDEDFRTTKEFMRSNGLNHQGMVLPFAQTNDLVRKVSKRYFDYVFGGKFQRTNPNLPGEVDNYTIDRVSIDAQLDRAKGAIDDAVANGSGWVVLISHIYNETFEDENHAREIIEYSLNKGMEWVKPSEGFARMGNLMQIDDTNTSLGTTIGADGSINSDKLARMQYESYREIGFDSPITDFEPNTHTITEINSPNASDFPRGLTGDLNTKRYGSSNAYSWQEYITTREMQKFMRSWDIDNDTWREFEQTDLSRYLGVNSLPVDPNPLGRDLRYKIVVSHITNNNSNLSSYPENRPGLIIVDSLRTIGSNPKREYHVYQSDRVYKSYWISSNAGWSEWKLQPNYVGMNTRGINKTIPAKSTSNEFLEVGNIKITDFVNIRPNKPLPNGILFNHYVEQDGRIRIVLANITDNPIEIESTTFEAHRIQV